MARIQVSATFVLDASRRVRTSDGYLIVPGRVARIGCQQYSARELGLSGDPSRILTAYRPPDEVFHPDSMASLRHKPLTLSHDAEVTPKNWREHAVGDVTDPIRDADEFIAAQLVIKDAAAIGVVERQERSELSSGYSFEPDWTAGRAPDGTAYDFVQRQIRHNHVALVDAARCGSACRVADSSPPETGVTKMKTVVVDGIPVEASDQAAAMLDKQEREITKLKGDLAAATAVLAETVQIGDTAYALSKPVELRAGVAKLIGDMDALRRDVMTPEQRDAMVAEWADTLDIARRLVPDMETKGKTCHAIRTGVLAKLATDEAMKAPLSVVFAGKKPEELDAQTARTAFALAVSLKPAGTPEGTPATVGDRQPDTRVADALNGNAVRAGDAAPAGTEPNAASLYQDRMANAWRTA